MRIDANQDKKCERNNQIVEELEKLKFPDFSPLGPILHRLIKIQNEKILEENLNQFFSNYEEKKSNGDMPNS